MSVSTSPASRRAIAPAADGRSAWVSDRVLPPRLSRALPLAGPVRSVRARLGETTQYGQHQAPCAVGCRPKVLSAI